MQFKIVSVLRLRRTPTANHVEEKKTVLYCRNQMNPFRRKKKRAFAKYSTITFPRLYLISNCIFTTIARSYPGCSSRTKSNPTQQTYVCFIFISNIIIPGIRIRSIIKLLNHVFRLNLKRFSSDNHYLNISRRSLSVNLWTVISSMNSWKSCILSYLLWKKCIIT